jgi:hypothetical protein
MIRTFITPTKSNFNLTLEFPDDYLGQELEIIVFKKQEGLVIEKETTQKKLSEKYRDVFTKEDAKSFNDHSQQMRKEWNNI